MSKYLIKRKIPKMAAAGEVAQPQLAGVQGLGMETLATTNPSSLDSILGGKIDEPTLYQGNPLTPVLDTGIYGHVGGDLTANVNPDKRQNRTGETDTFDFGTIPYYGADDISSRFMQMGQSIGRSRNEGYGDLSKGAKTANVLSGVFSGLSGVMGLTRNVFSGIAAGQGTEMNQRLADERLARQRRNSQIRYKDGGGVYLGPNNRFDSGSLTGEYLMPLPKSMEDQANVEVERGEYVTQPGEAPMEAMGQKHADGGTPVSLEEGTKVITDDTTIEPDFAKWIRDNYGIKATPKDTYATLMDRYKVKIGLKAAYDDQKKALDKLDKNSKIDDSNTRRLNESVLSKAINDSNETVNGLEERFKDFANMIYKEQEDRKTKEQEDALFKDGGEISMRLAEAKRKYGLSDEDLKEAKAMLMEKVASVRRKMADGGLAKLLGRKLTFRKVDNKFNNEDNTFGYQRMTGDGVYGGAGANDWRSEMARLNPGMLAAYDAAKEDKALAAQKAYYQTGRAWTNLSGLDGVIANADALRDYAALVNFGGEDSKGNYPNDKYGSYHDRSIDNKLGRFTTSRPTIALDIVTPDQKRRLNEAGITHFSQLFSPDNRDKVAGIMGDDMMTMNAIRDYEGLEGLDFMLDAYAAAPTVNPDWNIEDDVDLQEPELVDVSTLPGNNTSVDEGSETGSQRRAYGALMFPEVFRMSPSAVTSEGLERYDPARVDPVLRSADQYMVEANRAFQSQLDQMGAIPDSQRGALMSNMQAIMQSGIGKAINEVEQSNIQQRTYADNYNAQAYKQAADQNAAERLRYQGSWLQGQAINEENWNRYFDSINDEIQQKWNANTSMSTLRSIFGDVRIGPNGQLIVDPQGDMVYARRLVNDPAPSTKKTTTKKNG